MESQNVVGKAGVVGWQETGRGQVEVYYLYLIPFCTKRCMGHLGHQLLALRKGRKKNIQWERKGRDGMRWDTGDNRALTPPRQQRPSQAHLSLSPCSRISICGGNDPASGPCGHGTSRLIKMKWAADPMVPFRRAEHWPPDLYLIDQPVQEGKKDPLLQRGLFPLHCSISDRRSLWKMRNSFENHFLKPSWAKYCIKLRCTGKCG